LPLLTLFPVKHGYKLCSPTSRQPEVVVLDVDDEDEIVTEQEKADEDDSHSCDSGDEDPYTNIDTYQFRFSAAERTLREEQSRRASERHRAKQNKIKADQVASTNPPAPKKARVDGSLDSRPSMPARATVVTNSPAQSFNSTANDFTKNPANMLSSILEFVPKTESSEIATSASRS